MIGKFADYERDKKLEDIVPIENRITQFVIDNLKIPTFATIKDDDIIEYINLFCKKLLSYAKDNYESKEMAYAINLNTLDFVGAAFGTVRTIDIEPLIVTMEKTGYVYIVLHNHPSDGYFSPNDLNTFFGTPNISILVVLGNKGSVYIIEKGRDISQEEYIKIKKLIINYRSGKNSFMDTISELLQYGIVYNQL